MLPRVTALGSRKVLNNQDAGKHHGDRDPSYHYKGTNPVCQID